MAASSRRSGGSCELEAHVGAESGSKKGRLGQEGLGGSGGRHCFPGCGWVGRHVCSGRAGQAALSPVMCSSFQGKREGMRQGTPVFSSLPAPALRGPLPLSLCPFQFLALPSFRGGGERLILATGPELPAASPGVPSGRFGGPSEGTRAGSVCIDDFPW